MAEVQVEADARVVKDGTLAPGDVKLKPQVSFTGEDADLTDGNRALQVRARCLSEIGKRSTQSLIVPTEGPADKTDTTAPLRTSTLDRQAARARTFKVGLRFLHDLHGAGEVIEVMEDGRAKIQFDNGEVHRYRPQSLHKLKPIVEDAHKFSPTALFQMVDTDNSGNLSLEEFKTLHDIIIKDERKAASQVAELQAESVAQQEDLKRTRKVVLGLFIFVFLLLACIGGLMAAVVAAYKDTEAEDAYFADKNGNVLQTTPAVVALPLLAAPVLPIKQLHSVTRLTVSYEDGEFDEEVQVVENVIGIIAVNNTAVRFQMAGANVKEVRVWNGDATAILADDSEVELCEADVECSALMVKDAEAASTLLTEANAALVAAGFDATVAVESSRRRLMRGDSTYAGMCQSVDCKKYRKYWKAWQSLQSELQPDTTIPPTSTLLHVYAEQADCGGEPSYTIVLDEASENNCEGCWDRCASQVSGGSYRIQGPGAVAIAWNCIGMFEYSDPDFARGGMARTETDGCLASQGGGTFTLCGTSTFTDDAFAPKHDEMCPAPNVYLAGNRRGLNSYLSAASPPPAPPPGEGFVGGEELWYNASDSADCPYKKYYKMYKAWLKRKGTGGSGTSNVKFSNWLANRQSASYEVAADGSTIERRQLADKDLVAQYRTVHRPRFGELQKEIYGGSGDGKASTVDLVIARYDEDSSWLLDVERELPDVRIFVYEKGGGAKIPSACKTLALKSATCVPLANVGREAHAFLTHLIERYDDLGDKVVFTQAGPPGYGFLPGEQGGHLMPGSDFFYDYLSASSPPNIVFTMAYANIPSRELLLRRDGYLFNEPYDRSALPTDAPSVCSSNWHVVNNGTVHFWDALHAPVPEQDLPNQIEFYNTHMRDELGPLTGDFVPFANGAVVSAAGAKLRSRPKAFYERLRRLTSVGDQPDAIFYIELLFAYITGHEVAAHSCAAQIARAVEAPTDEASVRSAA